MKKTAMMLGLSTVLVSVVPAFALEAELPTGEPAAAEFKALGTVNPANEMSETELAAIEGQAPPQVIGQAGLVNVGAQVKVGDVRVIRDITVQDVNVAVLAAGRQN